MRIDKTGKEIVGLLADDARCQYQPWFKAHFTYPREELDLDAWKKKHSIKVEERARELTAQEWKVMVEDQNKMRVRGGDALFS